MKLYETISLALMLLLLSTLIPISAIQPVFARRDNEVLFSPGILEVDKWQHITWTFNHSHQRMYSNASLYNEASFSRDYLPDVTGLPFMFGFTEGWHATYFDLDEFAIYNRSLTEGEIEQRYNSQISPSGIGGIVSYWKFDEGSGYTAHDSFDANHGTLNNGVNWTEGISGSALSFRHRSVGDEFEYVLVPDASNLNLVHEATIEFWIKPTEETVNQSGLIFGKGDFDGIQVGGAWWGANIGTPEPGVWGIATQLQYGEFPREVSYWKFDENSGDIVYDSFDANHGTLENGVEWTTGISGSAISFRYRSEGGVFEHVLVPDARNLNLLHEATIEFWIKPTAEAVTQPGLIFGKGDFNGLQVGGDWWGTNIDSEMGITTQLQYADKGPGENTILFTPGILQVDEWQHITWRFDFGNMSVYRNAQLYAETQFSRDYLPDVTGLPFMFGFTEGWHATYFDLDEFAIYDGVLTEEEIKEHYKSLLRPPVNVTVSCYDIDGAPLYLASTMIVHPDYYWGISSGYTNSNGVFEAINLTLPSDISTVDICVSWGNASAPGQPGYYMYFSGIDATDDVELVVNASDLRAQDVLANVTLTLENTTDTTTEPMEDTRVFMGFSGGYPIGTMGPITGSDGIVTLYLSNGTYNHAWAPDPTYYTFVLCQMIPTHNTLFPTDMLVSSDMEATITVPSPSELNTIDLTFSSPNGISLMRDLRLYFEFPGMPTGINLDDLVTMSLPTKLHGEMLFAVPFGPGGAFWFPVPGDGKTSFCVNASMGTMIAAIYTNTTDVLGGPWIYISIKGIGPLPAGAMVSASMGGGNLTLNSVTPTEVSLGSTPILNASFTDAYDNPLTMIVGDGSTSIPTGFPGVVSHFAAYNITIFGPDGLLWYDGQALAYDPMGGSSLNGVLSGMPTFPSLDKTGEYNYTIFIDTGPWLLDPPGVPGDPLEGTFTVTRPDVGAWVGRYRVYTSDDYLQDSVPSVITGYLRSRYDIRPEGVVDVEGARIELETPFGPENFPDISWYPDAGYTQDYDEPSGNWTYAWDFGTLFGGQGAMVSLPTNFQVDFDPGFEGQRIWNPWITSESVTQTLTLEFTPVTISFHNVHVSVQIPKTPEASPTIDPGSISAYPELDEKEVEWRIWFDETEENIVVNWGGDPELNVTYMFSVDVTVQNKLFPEPIFYKPSAGFGANFDWSWSPPDTPVTIADDIDRDGYNESMVTYYGMGDFDWQEYVQSEHAVGLAWVSARAPQVWMEYNTGYWYSTMEDFVANDMLEGKLDGYSSVQYLEDGPGLNFNEPTLNFSLAEGFEVESWSEEWWVEGTLYRWEFPDLEEGQGAGSNVGIAGTFNFTPGSNVSRTLNPEVILYPGGEQEFNFTFTPIDETLNGVHFHIGLPEGEMFDARIISPTTDPENNIWLSEDQRHLWIQLSLDWPEDFHPHTFTVKIQVTLMETVAIRFVPTLHVDARTYFPEFEWIGSSPPPGTTEIGTWTWSSSGEYLWRWHDSHARNVVLEGYWEVVPPLTVKLSGEFDYLEKEKVKVRLAALVTDAISGEPVSDATVTLDIYDENGGLIVSDFMVEKVVGTGIYEWQSNKTLEYLGKDKIFLKGVYLVHVKASLYGGPVASDISQFHVDPPAEDFMPLATLIIAIIALIASIVTLLISFKQQIKRLFQKRSLCT